MDIIRSVGFERMTKQGSLCALHFSTVWRKRGAMLGRT